MRLVHILFRHPDGKRFQVVLETCISSWGTPHGTLIQIYAIQIHGWKLRDVCKVCVDAHKASVSCASPPIRANCRTSLKVHSYYTAIALRCRTAIEVLHESQIHLNLQCSDAAVTCGRDVINILAAQRNCDVVWIIGSMYEWTFTWVSCALHGICQIQTQFVFALNFDTGFSNLF